MAIDIKFDLVGNPEPPTILLANRNGNILGQLNVKPDSIDLSDKFNDASEFTFILNKYVNDELTYLWDKVVNFKLIYCKEWDMWFEISVELDEKTDSIKTVFCKQLGQAELSQIKLYDIEINTEDDIARDDYKISILYDEKNLESSILNMLLEKAPHYSIVHVDSTIMNIQRSFSFNDISICDAFQKIAEEIGCLFIYNSNLGNNGNIQRTISVYDLQNNCNDCGYRGEFIDICPKCGSANIKCGYGEDTSIFVTADELASSNIKLVTSVDSVKNCFKLEAGDDLMTATIRNCNPNGTDYIWYYSDDVKEDMSDELVQKINSYNELYNEYCNDKIVFVDTLSKNEKKTLIAGEDFQAGDAIRFMCRRGDIDKASITYATSVGGGAIHFGTAPTQYVYYDFVTKNNIVSITVNEYVESYLMFNISDYNEIVSKYSIYNKGLQEIHNPIKGYSSLMNAYYNTIDLELYLKSGLMPSVEMIETSASEQAKLLTSSSLSPVAVSDVSMASLATLDSAVLSMAKIKIKSTYKVQIKSSEMYDNGNNRYWKGNFIITNYSDEEDTAISNVISIKINDDLESFVKQKIDKALNKEDTDELSISGLFNMEYDGFCAELKKYALNPLISFRDACQACIDILIEQGIGNNVTWSDTEDGSNSNLYENLYTPYYNKLKAIEAESKIRENEINVISGIYDSYGNLIIRGLQTYIEKAKNEIQSILDFEKYLGNRLWLEFCAYRREDKYSNENYISDGLNNAELFKKASDFIEVAKNEIYKSSELQHSITTTLNNLLAIEKFKPLVKHFKVGNWLRVQIDNKIYKLRLLEYGINFSSFNDIHVEFSDVDKIKNGINDVKSVLSQASSMASSYNATQKQASHGEKSNEVVSDWVENGLNATNTKIVATDYQNQVWDKNGFLCRQYDPITKTYSDEQLKIINSTIAITDNNWESTKTAIGKYYYTDPNTKELKCTYGVNGETIVGKLLIGELLNISNDNGDLEFGKDGLMVTNDINTVNINPNDKSIVKISNDVGNIFSLNEKGELVVVGNITASSLTLLDGASIKTDKISGLSDVAISGSYDDLTDKPSLSAVATSGSYDDLTDKPDLSAVATSGEYVDLKNKPDLSAVAISGSYDDLSGAPDLASVAISGSYDDLTDKPSLSAVATSGSYKDLTDIEDLQSWVLAQIQAAINNNS